MKQLTVASLAQLHSLEALVTSSALQTLTRVREELQGTPDLVATARLKFEQVGCDPLDVGRALNFVEQLNQSFTYLATLEATRRLFALHPTHAPFHLNLGTAPGSDIASTDGAVAAETFAATHPDSNNKLRKDVERVRATGALYRYVFYLSPVAAKLTPTDVTVVRLDHWCLRNCQLQDV
jgi:hypothetical protein